MGRREEGGQVEDLPNRLYDMVVEFWQCAVEGGFLELLRHLSGVATGTYIGPQPSSKPTAVVK